MQKQSAFTLIELLISMAVLMILISVASQSYNRLFAHQALTASGERLYQFLRLANSQSVKYNKKVYVHFCQQGTTDRWMMALSEQSACDCFTDNSCLLDGLQQRAELSDGKLVSTSVDDITFNGLQASYNPMRFSVNAGSVILKDNNGYKLKVIQSTMRLRICTPNGPQLGYKQC
ncbi:GspH/FimT family pseudopilin [Psychromonas hadalis]|uniref:GspH/FimT family pseudopilin n=1 Tax=Psychromonas hadalis TaxID=211669 RepID=UPI0003B4FA8E|nr:GspH/FimT family pseudopilin [Psychromonas hadalis]